MIEIIIGGVFTIGSSLIAYAVGSKKAKAELVKTEIDILKTIEETEHLRIDNNSDKLDLIDKLMAKIDAMQVQINCLQATVNKLEYERCKGVDCPTAIEYNKILAKRAARKKYAKKPTEVDIEKEK